MKAYNLAGKVDLVIDIVGYYVAGGGGATGPAGPPGPQGAPGANGTNGTPGSTGPRGFSAWDIIPAGTLLTGSGSFEGVVATNDATKDIIVDIGAFGRHVLTNANVNWADFATADQNVNCTGTAAAPTAPTGEVCIYVGTAADVDGTTAQGVGAIRDSHSFGITFETIGTAGQRVLLTWVWAYQA